MEGTRQGDASSGAERMDMADQCVIGRSEGEFLLGGGSGTLLQCPPLAAVIVTCAGLSGKVHHVVLLTGAAGIQTQ